jgi:hypothetical protein
MSHRNITIVLFLCGATFVYCLLQLSSGPQALKALSDELDFKMPRPQSHLGDFDLSDREVEIIRTKKQQEGRLGVEHKLIPLPDRSKDTKKNLKAESKKNTKNQQEKVLSVETVEAPDSDWSVSEELKNLEKSFQRAFFAGSSSPKKVEPEIKEQKEKINWMELLRSAPTQENAKKLVVALMANEVSTEEYFQISRELINENNSNWSEVGLFLTKAVPGFDSLVLLIEYSERVSPEERVVIQSNYLNDYASVLYYGSVARLLATDKKEFIEESFRLIDLILSKSESPSPESSGRIRVRQAAAGNFKNDLKVFIEPLKKIAKLTDSPFAQQAKNTFDRINQATAATEAAPRTASEALQ